MRKTLDEIKKINTNNLLRYYKAERKRFFGNSSRYRCGCCGEFLWDLYKDKEPLENEYDSHVSYLNLIKSELNNREHIK